MGHLGRSSLVGRPLAHYRIVTAIGAGGMGEVYRATDTRLGRDVALKVLPAEMANDPDRLARFQREARAVAALNHPNVVTLYSVEEDEGVHFITMELIEGEPLDRLISAKGLPADRILEIAGAIAEALTAAHDKGIVHRDLKPANVMVAHDGRVKVLDFGLAKDVGAESGNNATLTSAGQTQAGMVMGTPAYMSPEQVSGRSLDHRSDIFSLGVLLHEMATGRRPFEAASSAEMVSAILRDHPASVTEVRPDLPSDLARIIRRCLEKDPRHRLQTARDVSNEFRDLVRSGSRPATSPASSSSKVVPPSSAQLRADEGFWVAVLPFRYAGTNEDLRALAEGLSEEIVTGLSRFSYLRVIARGSTARYAGQSVDVRSAGKELNARYVMEGSLRQAGSKVRIAVQLVDAATGAGLWAETYDRAFTPESMLDLIDDVVPRIVATVGDTQGILAHSMTEALRHRDLETLTPHEALLRSFGFHQHVSAAEHLAGRTALEHALKQAPDHAECWAALSWLCRAEYTHQYNPLPNSMDRSLEAARKAVALAPSNQLAHAALASAFYFRKELAAFRNAAERAISLNKMEGYTTAFLAMEFAFSGDWARGCELAQHATQLNPHHPGWYWMPMVMDAYRRGDYQRALDYAIKISMPGLWTVQVVIVAIHSRLGETEQARAALRSLLVLRPDFVTAAREELSKWWQPDMVEQLLDDLRKAGLESATEAATPAIESAKISSAKTTTAGAPSPSGSEASRTSSGSARTQEGFWVAVLPFRYSGTNDDLKALAEGLSEEVITGLSRFSYLRVIARGSTARYSNEQSDVRAIGKELGARYVMEGSLRQAGSKLRVAVQLVDTDFGTHLWAETYEHAFQPESLFEVQDDLVPRIVATVADQYGVLPRSMSELLRAKPDDSLTPHEAVLRAFSYFARITPEEHAAVRVVLERAVRDAPDHADSWAMLSMIYRGEFAQGFNAQPNSLDRALAAARHAVELAPTHALGHYAMATASFFRKEMISFRIESEQAVSLNPMDGSVRAYLGLLTAASGEWDRGSRMVDSAMKLNPNYPGWFHIAAFAKAYRESKFEEALEAIARMNMPRYFHTHAGRAAAFGQLGRREEGMKAVQELLALRPDFATTARVEYAKWYQEEEVERLLDGLRKAGLEIVEDR